VVVAAVLRGNVREAVEQAVGAPEGLLEPVAHVIDLTRERPVAIGHCAEGATGKLDLVQEELDLADVVDVGLIIHTMSQQPKNTVVLRRVSGNIAPSSSPSILACVNLCSRAAGGGSRAGVHEGQDHHKCAAGE